MAYDKDLPYNDLPSLPPEFDVDTIPILKQVNKANKMLAELKGVGESIPNQGVLISGIVLQEAKMSSEIENIVTTNDELYQAESAQKLTDANPNTKEVIHYREALWEGFETLHKRPLTVNTIIEIFQVIKQTSETVRKVPGTKISNGTDIVYTPPVGEQIIKDKLDNLINYIHAEDDIDPLIKLAIMHYQFEAIHPFSDGNGRTGRIINILYLVEQELLNIPVLYLSRYIIQNKTAYYEGLRLVTENGDWENWILFMLQAIEATAELTKIKIQSIKEFMEDIHERVQKMPGIGITKDLIELIFEFPYCKIKHLEDRGIAKRHTASKYLHLLEDMGILKSQRIGREVYYVNEFLISVLKA